MKKFYLIKLLLFISFSIFSQKSIKLFVGGNYTSVREVRILQNEIIDSLLFDYKWILLPNFGLDYNIPLNNKITFTTGLGLSFMGNKDSFEPYHIENEVPWIKELLEKNPNLIINYLRIPIQLKFSFKNSLSVYGGYAFQYTLRRNQPMYYNEGATVWNPYFWNRNYFHTINLGIEKTWKKLSFSLGTIIPISYMSDTGWDWKNVNRAYSVLYGMQFSAGYLIFE